MAETFEHIKSQLQELEVKSPEIQELTQSLNQRMLELYSLYQIGLALSATLDLDEIFKLFQKIFQQTLKVDGFGIFLIDNAISTLELHTSFGIPANCDKAKTSFKFGEDAFGEALMYEKTIYIPDISKQKRYRFFRDGTTSGAFLVIPLFLRKNHPVGIISLYRRAAGAFTENEISLFKKISEEIAKVIDKTLLFRETKELSITDELTGLYNRRYFNERFDREVQRAKRYKRPLAVLMIDIDYFKNFNDVNGHLMGDEILKRVAHTLDSNIRKADLLARYGGEEFVVVLPEIDKNHALQVAEKLRATIDRKRFPKQENQPGKNLTISVGVAAFPGDSTDARELVDLADRALYKAKAAGRNQVVAFNSSLENHQYYYTKVPDINS
ncbi:MAG: sensor domain-containing diguanylate cyclase [Calditrichaeota bacterium]|nr:sensor domain-containing diguanylate cyclase [Calditrichota bacterium]